MKTYKVHVVYGSREDIQALADILARHEIAFSFSGEYIYGSSPFDAFIKEHVPLEIATRLRPCVERWAESCGNYEVLEDSDTEFTIRNTDGLVIKAMTAPLYTERMREFLKKARESLGVHFCENSRNGQKE